MMSQPSQSHESPVIHRDPAGFIFRYNGIVYRQINPGYASRYEQLMSSGLYQQLTARGWLIPHVETGELAVTGAYKVILPERIPFITYPYEWCFGQLQSAAGLTLSIMRECLQAGMILKDATPYNIQFLQGRPVLIDTLSFETYDPQWPWIAYRQFCETFLFPLLISHYSGFGPARLFAAYPEGIPASATAALLPLRARLSLGVWLHVLLQRRVQASAAGQPTGRFSKQKMEQLISHLESIVRSLRPQPARSHWTNYYQALSPDYLREKEAAFLDMIGTMPITRAVDIGCHDGRFARLLAASGFTVLAADEDADLIQSLFSALAVTPGQSIYPVLTDLSNPSPAQGFGGAERRSFAERARSALVCALGLVHHLVLGKNIPLPALARFLAGLCTAQLIIEFIPLQDPRAAALVANKLSYHQPYDMAWFEDCFEPFFQIRSKRELLNGRVLYLMDRRV